MDLHRAPMLHFTHTMVVYSEDRTIRWACQKAHVHLAYQGTRGAYQSFLNLSLLLVDWENFSVVHASPTFCLLPQESFCDWVWLEEEKLRACLGHKKHESLHSGLCSCFKPDTVDVLLGDFSHSIPCLPVPPVPAYTCQTLTWEAYVYVSPKSLHPSKEKIDQLWLPLTSFVLHWLNR